MIRVMDGHNALRQCWNSERARTYFPHRRWVRTAERYLLERVCVLREIGVGHPRVPRRGRMTTLILASVVFATHFKFSIGIVTGWKINTTTETIKVQKHLLKTSRLLLLQNCRESCTLDRVPAYYAVLCDMWYLIMIFDAFAALCWHFCCTIQSSLNNTSLL